MMSTIHRYISSFVKLSAISFLLISPVITNGKSNSSLIEVRRFAETLEKKSDFENAITEYLKISCFSDDKNVKADANYRIGLCYRELGLWEMSQKAFQKAILLSESDSLKFISKLSAAAVSIAERNFDKAQVDIMMMLGSMPQSLKEQAAMLLISSSIIQQDFKKTKKFIEDFGLYCNNKELIKKLDSILNIINLHETKSPITAKWLSTFLPGLGQIYAGDYRNSANSFILNAVNFFATGLYIYYGDYGNALLYFLFLTERYYSGNRYHAEQSVIKTESHISSRNSQNLLELIRTEKISKSD